MHHQARAVSAPRATSSGAELRLVCCQILERDTKHSAKELLGSRRRAKVVDLIQKYVGLYRVQAQMTAAAEDMPSPATSAVSEAAPQAVSVSVCS